MKDMKALGKLLGRNHALALALWETGWYEARMLTAFVADPARLTAAQMDRWCEDFDNWAYLRHPVLPPLRSHAARLGQGRGVEPRGRVPEAHGLRAALEPGPARQAGADEAVRRGAGLIERAAGDDRNFVKKAVSMALRAIGKRNRSLKAAAFAVASRLAGSSDGTARSIGKDALRAL